MLPAVQVVVGILCQENKVLVGKRPDGKPYAGFWEFPGGKIEAGESSDQALKRELEEELTIKATAMQPWFQHTHTYPDKTVVLTIWWVKAFEGKIKSQVHQSLKWVTLSELQQLPILEGNYLITQRLATVLS